MDVRLRDEDIPLFAETADTDVASQLVLRKNGFREVARKPGSVTWRVS